MTTSTELRSLWADWYGEDAKANKSVLVGFQGDGKVWELPVADRAGDAFKSLAEIAKRHGYLFRESAGGTWVVRNIAGTNIPSLHSYGIAMDWNPSKNAFGQCGTDIPTAMRTEVLALRTGNGFPVFTWGGNWRPCDKSDPMHFQIDCSPAALLTGIKGVAIPPNPTYPGGTVSVTVTRSTVQEGDKNTAKGSDEKIVQALLHAHGYGGTTGTIDGIIGSKTDTAIRQFQSAKKLTVDGIVGANTWKALEA